MHGRDDPPPLFRDVSLKISEMPDGVPVVAQLEETERATAQIKHEAKPVSPPVMMLQNGKTWLIPGGSQVSGNPS